MADEKSTTTYTPQEETFPVERLIEESGAFFGEPSHVAAGAFSLESRKTLTLTQAERSIKDFLKRPVEG